MDMTPESDAQEPTGPSAGELQRVVDRLAIEDTLTRYSTALDTRHLELFDDVFTPDSVIDYRASGGTKGGYRELRDWLREAMSVFDSWQHLLMNKVITVDGDNARARTDVYNPLSRHAPDGSVAVLHVGAVYDDALVRTDQGWRIAERTLTMVWTDGATPADLDVIAGTGGS